MTFSRLWKAVNISGGLQTWEKRGPNWVLSVAPGMVTYQLLQPYATKEQVLIYMSVEGWVAHLTGTEGKEVTDRLPQERWEELYSAAQAALAITGDIGKLPLQEIF
jgi:hypothetical protein